MGVNLTLSDPFNSLSLIWQVSVTGAMTYLGKMMAKTPQAAALDLEHLA